MSSSYVALRLIRMDRVPNKSHHTPSPNPRRNSEFRLRSAHQRRRSYSLGAFSTCTSEFALRKQDFQVSRRSSRRPPESRRLPPLAATRRHKLNSQRPPVPLLRSTYLPWGYSRGYIWEKKICESAEDPQRLNRQSRRYSRLAASIFRGWSG